MKLSLVLCALAMWAVAVVNCAAPLNAPAPSVDCSTLVFSLADCLSFVTNGSKVSKPEGTCCSGLKTMLKTGPQCLCEGFKNSAQFGVVLNVTKAMALPSACSVSAPPMSNCGLPGASLDAAPAHSPKSSSLSPKSPKSRTSSPVAPAPAPATSSMGPIVAQAPAPGSGASSASISFAVLLVSLVVATCSYF